MFVVFAMATFLAPTVHNRIDLRLVKAVEDVDSISQLDWCSFVLLRLNQAVESWRTNDTKNVGGCLMFLQLMYFHRLTWWGLPEPTRLPLLQHWTLERLKERMAQEVAAYPHHRGFGIGIWELPTYPISRHQVKRLYRRSNDQDPPSRFIQLPLPEGIQTDAELQASYADVRVRSWMTTRRNLSVVSVMHKSLMHELAAQEGLADVLQSGSVASTVGEGEQSQGSFTQALGSPGFVAAWNALGEKLDALVNVEMVEAPSFSLGLDDIGVTSQRTGPTNTRSKGRKSAAPK
ncbi:uncharacterized protein LOC141615155 isoform X1 [Silene latifolia]|uniref:uncharacterized protein LOC141615155 isoform X1 n=1 Tax=Silene latifolia TaxID=37657 RepID=UPI003D783E37